MNSKVILLFGPPGTGKSTTLADSARKAVSLKQDRNCMILCSLTNTAAKELARRDVSVNPQQIGTMHALCYRALDRPELVYKDEHIEAWNRLYPGYRLPLAQGSRFAPEHDRATEQQASAGPGEEAQQQADLARHQMRPFDGWPLRAQSFYPKWKAFKEERGVMDFTDLIEAGLSMEAPPFGVKLGILDEAQDSSALEWAVWHHWTSMMDYSMAAGDDQQVLYQWRGADPKSLVNMDPTPQEIRVLPHSYRLPIKVHRYVERWGEQIRVRYPKQYTPKDEEGRIIQHGATLQHPAYLTDILDNSLANGKTVMILASCQYMLTHTIHFLREHGYPFGNAWRPTNGLWNPLARKKKQVHTADRVAAYLAPQHEGTLTWTATQIKRWAPLVDANHVFVRGSKAAIAALDEGETPLPFSQLAAWFHPEAMDGVLSGSPSWLMQHCVGNVHKQLAYPVAIAQKRPEALTEPPPITVGTIHSLKGSQADVVIIYPDLSPSGYTEWSGNGRDSVLRQFYVALSRASDTLVLARPTSSRAVQWVAP